VVDSDNTFTSLLQISLQTCQSASEAQISGMLWLFMSQFLTLKTRSA
jgi:hypothetical protein